MVQLPRPILFFLVLVLWRLSKLLMATDDIISKRKYGDRTINLNFSELLMFYYLPICCTQSLGSVTVSLRLGIVDPPIIPVPFVQQP